MKVNNTKIISNILRCAILSLTFSCNNNGQPTTSDKNSQNETQHNEILNEEIEESKTKPSTHTNIEPTLLQNGKNNESKDNLSQLHPIGTDNLELRLIEIENRYNDLLSKLKNYLNDKNILSVVSSIKELCNFLGEIKEEGDSISNNHSVVNDERKKKQINDFNVKIFLKIRDFKNNNNIKNFFVEYISPISEAVSIQKAKFDDLLSFFMCLSLEEKDTHLNDLKKVIDDIKQQLEETNKIKELESMKIIASREFLDSRYEFCLELIKKDLNTLESLYKETNGQLIAYINNLNKDIEQVEKIFNEISKFFNNIKISDIANLNIKEKFNNIENWNAELLNSINKFKRNHRILYGSNNDTEPKLVAISAKYESAKQNLLDIKTAIITKLETFGESKVTEAQNIVKKVEELHTKAIDIFRTPLEEIKNAVSEIQTLLDRESMEGLLSYLQKIGNDAPKNEYAEVVQTKLNQIREIINLDYSSYALSYCSTFANLKRSAEEYLKFKETTDSYVLELLQNTKDIEKLTLENLKVLVSITKYPDGENKLVEILKREDLGILPFGALNHISKNMSLEQTIEILVQCNPDQIKGISSGKYSLISVLAAITDLLKFRELIMIPISALENMCNNFRIQWLATNFNAEQLKMVVSYPDFFTKNIYNGINYHNALEFLMDLSFDELKSFMELANATTEQREYVWKEMNLGGENYPGETHQEKLKNFALKLIEENANL